MSGYGTNDGFDAWLSANGLAVPSGGPSKDVLRIRGAAYVDGLYGPRLGCSAPTGGIDQERSWPRTGHFANGVAIDPDVIPVKWVQASYRAGYLVATLKGFGSATLDPSKRVKRQKVDSIEREFFDGGEAKAGAGGFMTIDAEIDGLVSGLLCHEDTGAFGGLWSVG